MKNRLQATIGLPQAVALYIGAVLGSGILLIPGMAAEMAGPASLLAWGGMMVLVLPMALSMGILSARFPNAGGVSHFVTEAFGEKWGALVGWFFFMSVQVGAPVVALTGGGYFCAALGWEDSYKIGVAVGILIICLMTNLLGMKVAGSLQIVMMIAIITVLVLGIAGAVPNIEAKHFTPFIPNGWFSVVQAATLLFWCFIGWEAISHLSEEFVNPQREAIKGITIAAIVIGILYVLTAVAVIGTHSYGDGQSSAPFVHIVEKVFGEKGAFVTGMIGFLTCTASQVSYIGATSRVAYSLAIKEQAPKHFAITSKKTGTPIGSLVFLAGGFTIVLILYSMDFVRLSTLLQIPNASFILTYICGCAAGVRLLKGNKWGIRFSYLSLIITSMLFPFTGWSILYPLLITCFVFAYLKLKHTKGNEIPM